MVAGTGIYLISCPVFFIYYPASLSVSLTVWLCAQISARKKQVKTRQDGRIFSAASANYSCVFESSKETDLISIFP